MIGRDWLKAVVAGADVTYENGAIVQTSFVTSFGAAKVTVCPELHCSVEAASRAALVIRAAAQRMPKYEYPVEVATAARLGWIASHGIAMEIMPDSCVPIRALESPRAKGKAIYGGGLLLSQSVAAEKAAAEKWSLSEAEKEIVSKLK